jgi:pyrimidine-nucleoside phosphorylase
MDKRMTALITDMNQPLGRTAGNALEIRETIESLKGHGPDDLMEVTRTLCAYMLVLTDKVQAAGDAFALLDDKIAGGQALEKFREMVRLQGGNPEITEDETLLPAAEIRQAFPAPQSGYVVQVDAECIGRAALVLGAGRRKTDDEIDYSVGISDLVKIGEHAEEGQPLAILHANDLEQLEEAQDLLKEAFVMTEKKGNIPSLITEIIEG